MLFIVAERRPRAIVLRHGLTLRRALTLVEAGRCRGYRMAMSIAL